MNGVLCGRGTELRRATCRTDVDGMDYGTERYCDRPDPRGRCDVGRLLPFVHGTVGSLGVTVISRDLTRTYSGRCMEWD